MKTPSLLTLLLAGLFLTSCASFERDWKQSVADYEAGKISAPAGPWNRDLDDLHERSHRQPPRSRDPVGEKACGSYDFRYHATWKRILSGTYTVAYPVKKSGGVYKVDGEQNLGIFRTFRHRATIDRNSFEATYSNNKGRTRYLFDEAAGVNRRARGGRDGGLRDDLAIRGCPR